jgi:tetratricopeptide (TPR) repeat protein
LVSHVERGGQPAETTPRGPGFALRLLDGRALLTAVALDLDGLPDVPAGMTAQLLTLEVPHVRFPLEASGGAHKFRHRRLQLRTLDLRVPLPSLLALAPRTLCGFPVTHVSLDGVDGQLQARFVVETPSGAEDVVVQLALVPAPPAAVDVVVTRVAWLGAHGVALEVVEALAVALGARRQGSLTLRVEPVAPLLTRVLVCHGWKAPSLEKVEDLQVELLAGALRLRVLAEAAADAAAPQAAGGLARAAGANSVLSGASVQGGTRARSLDRAAAHPLALALTADALLQDPGARSEVEAALALAHQRFPGDVDLLLTSARLAPNSPAGWRQLLAATSGDAALAHGAAWLLGRTSLDLTALRRACAERPDHADSWVTLARVAADQQQWGEAAAAARAALELDLSPAQEAQAATALGEVRLAQGDLAGARQALLRAQRQGATYTGAAAAYGRLLSLEGRHAEAVHHLNRAVDAAVDEQSRRTLLAQAAAVTLDGLKDPAGAVALWRRVMAPGGAVESYRGPAARAAWMAQDAELAGHWALGRGEGLPKDRVAALYGGLALARAGGQPVRARLLLEFAGEDAALRDDTWAAALASVQQAQVPAVPDEGTGVTSALLVSTAEDAPGPGENIHEELPEEDRTELRASPFAAVTEPSPPAVRVARVGPARLDVPTLAAMEPVEAATVFLHAYDAPGALRPALMELLDTLCETAPDRALAVMEELQARDPLPLTRWRLLARHAHQLGQALAEMAAWEVVRTTAPEAAQEALLHQAELLRAQDRAPDALARLMPQAMEEGGVLALRAADLAEELDQPDVALALLGAAEARTQGADGLAWPPRAGPRVGVAPRTRMRWRRRWRPRVRWTRWPARCGSARCPSWTWSGHCGPRAWSLVARGEAQVRRWPGCSACWPQAPRPPWGWPAHCLTLWRRPVPRGKRPWRSCCWWGPARCRKPRACTPRLTWSPWRCRRTCWCWPRKPSSTASQATPRRWPAPHGAPA